MADSLAQLENQRAALLAELYDLDDFHRGSVTTTSGKCGKPSCHCAKFEEAVHGPNFRLSRKGPGQDGDREVSHTGGLTGGAARSGRVSPLPQALPRTGPGE
jgi:hypothetical protein